jgi:DNA repair ATPase RecN
LVHRLQKVDTDVVHVHNRSHDFEACLASEGEFIRAQFQIAEVKLIDIQKLEREALEQNVRLVSEQDTLLHKLETLHIQLADTKRVKESYCERSSKHSSEAHNKILTTILHLDLQKCEHC